ncbi:tryptophan-rich sensory protein [Paraferrimonas sedimenticola]|uniref:Tryptophan-rich sensory protein n=1 Tax=Paraferrimonas sedimenticola TaxID=375674 RepID=A0AA37VWP3_9GAMM|nr:tryptophan-rich sensory protein [Paraferrimonas sedimenticola]GLP96461.1 tryptophan-rich sensory protein [Paraferrimonas sedimenticola]
MNQWINWKACIAAYVLVILVNALANIIPIGGLNTGQVSALYPSLFTPAGYVFAIWSLIYLWLTGFVVYQARAEQRERPLIQAIRVPFVYGCLANASWIFVWHYQLIALAMLAIAALLWFNYRCYQLIQGAELTRQDKLWLAAPISLYLGWIAVANIANISSLQTAWDLNDFLFNAIQWTWLKLALAGSVAAWFLLKRDDVIIPLVVLWAAAGIAVKQAATPEVSGAAATLTLLSAILCGYYLSCRWSRSRE